MIQRRTGLFALAISILFHFFVLSSREVMGFFLGGGAIAPPPKPKEDLVFDLVEVKEEKPEPEPEKQKWFVDAQGNKEQPTAPTNLMGVEQSAAMDHAPKDKTPDGIPNLDGTSEMVAVRDQEAVLGETKPKLGGSPAPQPPLPAQPAQPKSSPPTEPPRETKPEKETRPKIEPGPEKEMALARREERILPVKPEHETKPNVEAPSPRKEEGPDKNTKMAEAEPPAQPVQIAAVPRPSIAPQRDEPQAAPQEPGAPGPTIPPRVMAKLQSMFPESSAGKEGEPSFNINLDKYAVYYQHIAERLELTWHLLRRYEAGLPMPGAPQGVKLIFTFTILRDGRITDLKLVSDGGDPMVAGEVERVIERTALDPFPSIISEEKLLIRPVIHFRYY